MEKCSTEKYTKEGLVRCDNDAVWRHPRWAGGICEEHKKTLSDFFPNDWIRIKEDSDG